MEAKFWQQIWQDNELGFHQKQVHPWLSEHLRVLGLNSNSRIFLPLCGKTNDIAWLLSQGHQVVGVELVENAVEQLFSSLRVTPEITHQGTLKCYKADNLVVWVGDFFALTQPLLGTVDAIYDRAALVALPYSMRLDYTAHMLTITDNAPQLLITFSYDQSAMDGPPFSVNEAEINNHYLSQYHITPITSAQVQGGLKGLCEAMEYMWLLQPKTE